MAIKVCSKCGVASEEAKPSKCSKCGSRDFHDSLGSAFAKKASTPEAVAVEPAPAPPKPPEFYTGRDMYTAHAKYHINGMHFDEVADVLKDVLTAAGMAKPDIALVMLRVESLREMIIA